MSSLSFFFWSRKKDTANMTKAAQKAEAHLFDAFRPKGTKDPDAKEEGQAFRPKPTRKSKAEANAQAEIFLPGLDKVPMSEFELQQVKTVLLPYLKESYVVLKSKVDAVKDAIHKLEGSTKMRPWFPTPQSGKYMEVVELGLKDIRDSEWEDLVVAFAFNLLLGTLCLKMEAGVSRAEVQIEIPPFAEPEAREPPLKPDRSCKDYSAEFSRQINALFQTWYTPETFQRFLNMLLDLQLVDRPENVPEDLDAPACLLYAARGFSAQGSNSKTLARIFTDCQNIRQDALGGFFVSLLKKIDPQNQATWIDWGKQKGYRIGAMAYHEAGRKIERWRGTVGEEDAFWKKAADLAKMYVKLSPLKN
jgi:hypothetical protein